MIRKILISLFLIYTLAWFAVAHLIKSNVVNTVNNTETDNIKISYNQIKVSGFPGHLQIGLSEPKIKLIYPSYSKEIFTDKIIFAFAWSFKKAQLILGQAITQITNFEREKSEYIIQSKDDIIAWVKFSKPTYKWLDIDLSIIKFFQLNNKLLSIIHDNKEIFTIADLTCITNKTKNLAEEEIGIQASLLYSSPTNFFNFKKAAIDFSIFSKFSDNENNKLNSIKNFNINHLRFSCDDNAEIYLVGGLQFLEDKLPNGKLSFELTNYHNIVDKLIPNNLLLPKRIVRLIIDKAVIAKQPEIVKADGNTLERDEKVKLDIDFSDKGIHIGSINLLEFNLEENKENNYAPQAIEKEAS